MVKMIDITPKEVIYREAEACGVIRLRRDTIRLIKEGKVEKGDPLKIAELASILAAKKTPELIPLCHPIEITNVKTECTIVDDEHVKCCSRVKAVARTGVEMEALTATMTALLNIWDVVKKYEKDEKGLYPVTCIEEVRVTMKEKKALAGR